MNPAPVQAARYLTLAALAEYTSVSESTLRRMVADGELPPPIKFRDCVRYDREAIDAALTARNNAKKVSLDEAIRRLEVPKRGRKAA